MWLLERAWDKGLAENPQIEIRRTTSRGEAADFKKCRVCVEKILADDNYNPYKMEKIIDTEVGFKMELPGEEWMVDEDGGGLKIRGFIDLVREIDEDTVEIVDWKTGKRVDFYSRRPIDTFELLKLVQPRIYHLAASQLYSQYKNIIITFHYIEDGGPITISLGLDDLILTLAAVWRFFDTASKDTLLVRNRSWTCRMCAYERSKICQRVWIDFHNKGNEYIQQRYVDLTFDQQKEMGYKADKVAKDEI
jgi:hypothetical protein